MRCDSYWREQQQLHFQGEPLTPENQRGLAVWTEVKLCLYNVITECQVWQQQRIIAWDKKQNPSQAEQLIAQQVHWLATGSLASTSNPKGKEPKGATGLVEQACSTAQESEKEDALDFEQSSDHDSAYSTFDHDEPASATQEITGLLSTKQQPSYRIVQGGVYHAVKESTDVVRAQCHQGVRLTVIYTVTGVHGI